MSQTRGRLYIIMVRVDMASRADMQTFLHLVHDVLPDQLRAGSTIEQVMKYNRDTEDECQPLVFPPKARDTGFREERLKGSSERPPFWCGPVPCPKQFTNSSSSL